MMTVVVAEENERQLAEQYFPNCPVIVTGVGAINVFRSLQSVPRQTELINIGYAGSADFPIGSLVEVSEVRLCHPNVTYAEPKLELLPLNLPNTLKTKICYSNCDFVLQSKETDCVFDMELAFIAAMGFENLHALKIVSDNLSLHQYHELSNGVE